jgi:hypothetical protein
MLQLIARSSAEGLLRGWECLADPDELLDIARRASAEGDSSQEASYAERFSRILHDIQMGGVWKRTNGGRLKESERMLCAHMDVPQDGPLLLLDIGASDGITTLELLQSIRRARRVDAKIVLADLNLRLDRYRRGPLVEYRAANGEPIMARIGRLGIRLARRRHGGRDPLSRQYLALTRLRRTMRIDVRISLVNPLVAQEAAISAREMNCLERYDDLVGRFAAVRASNVLNLEYFGANEIHRALDHIFAYLREGGCLVVSRNMDQPQGEVENGSVWKKTQAGFRWIQDFGAGSEIKDIVPVNIGARHD